MREMRKAGLRAGAHYVGVNLHPRLALTESKGRRILPALHTELAAKTSRRDTSTGRLGQG
jgi:hypothetical protein